MPSFTLTNDYESFPKTDENNDAAVLWLHNAIETLKSTYFGNTDNNTVTSSGQTSPAVTCHGLKCPKFKTIEKFLDYEKRCYDFIDWVQISQYAGLNETVGLSRMYYTLLTYIDGHNDKSKKIRKTLPIMLRVRKLEKKDKPDLELIFHFFVSPDMAKDMPKPLAKGVKFLHRNRNCFFVRPYKGYVASYGDIMRLEAKKLEESLTRDNRRYQKGKWFFMSYDFPNVYTGRYNEVLVKTRKR